MYKTLVCSITLQVLQITNETNCWKRFPESIFNKMLDIRFNQTKSISTENIVGETFKYHQGFERGKN